MRILILLLTFISLSFCSFSQTEKRTVHFDFNSDALRPDATVVLDSFIKETPIKTPLTLYGHTDSKGSSSYNFDLSRRRVNTVKNYLLSHGYSEELIGKENALGKTALLAPDEGDDIKALNNRRVEISFQTKAPVVVKEPEPIPVPAQPVAAEPAAVRTIKDIIEDTATKKGTTVIVENLQFEGGRHRLLRTSFPPLKDLLAALKANPKLSIAIEGHICCVPGPEDQLDFDTYTEDLSMQRAKAIFDYLVFSGIDRERLTYKGYGHTDPIFPYPEKSPAQQIANRRVEFKILNK